MRFVYFFRKAYIFFSLFANLNSGENIKKKFRTRKIGFFALSGFYPFGLSLSFLSQMFFGLNVQHKLNRGREEDGWSYSCVDLPDLMHGLVQNWSHQKIIRNKDNFVKLLDNNVSKRSKFLSFKKWGKNHSSLWELVYSSIFPYIVPISLTSIFKTLKNKK